MRRGTSQRILMRTHCCSGGSFSARTGSDRHMGHFMLALKSCLPQKCPPLSGFCVWSRSAAASFALGGPGMAAIGEQGEMASTLQSKGTPKPPVRPGYAWCVCVVCLRLPPGRCRDVPCCQAALPPATALCSHPPMAAYPRSTNCSKAKVRIIRGCQRATLKVPHRLANEVPPREPIFAPTHCMSLNFAEALLWHNRC